MRRLQHPHDRSLRTEARAGAPAPRRGLPRTARWIVGALLLSLALIPVFQANVLEPGDEYFFSNWDKESQALVLGHIEQEVREDAQASRWGLQNATPDVLSPYDTFDGLQYGQHPEATGYRAYSSSLGLQGRLFAGLYAGGCSTLNCLTTVESSLFSIAFVFFAAGLAVVTRRSLGVVVLVSGLLSPWVVSSAHNLYWVPWTWLLPAIAACGSVAFRDRRWRIACLVAVGLGTALKATTGYEFITTTILLAASIPVLSQVLGRRRAWRTVIRHALLITAAALAGFGCILVAHALVAGDGSLTTGIGQITHDALKRTYGSPALGADAVTVESLKVSPLRVLVIYLVDWRTTVFSLGVGQPTPPLALGPGSFWVLVVAAGATIVVDLIRDRSRWRTNAVVFLVTALPPVSWFVLGKSHSFTATSVNFVLWYLIFLPSVLWILGSVLADVALVRNLRQVLSSDRALTRRTTEAAAPRRRQGGSDADADRT